MTIRLCSASAAVALLSTLFTACTIDQEAALVESGSRAGSRSDEAEKSKERTESPWAEQMRLAREEREKAKAEVEKQKALELARKEKEEAEAARRKAAGEKALALREKREAEEEARREAAEKNAEELRERALAEAKEKEEQAREAEIAARKAAKEREKAAKIAAREKARSEREAREKAEEAEEDRFEEIPAVAERRTGGGFFSRLAISSPDQYKSEGHHIKVNQGLLGALEPSNASIEIDLGEQMARIYKGSGPAKQLVIETQVSTGRSGYSTPTGSYRIQEKLVEKKSSIYGRWVNASGATVVSDGNSGYRPAGGHHFIGADMPYWMRVTGGIGMHIGYVPNGPASHGCIRVPSAVQPLIYSKVGVGTRVTITH